MLVKESILPADSYRGTQCVKHQRIVRRRVRLEFELGRDEGPGKAHGIQIGKGPGEQRQEEVVRGAGPSERKKQRGQASGRRGRTEGVLEPK